MYYKTAGGSWTKAGDTTGTSFTWTGAKTNETYYFTVRGLSADGKTFTAGYSSTGWSHKYFPTPEVTKLESTTSGVKITWGAINGAEQYRVYYKTAGGSWTKAGDTTGTSFTWTGAKTGETYYFTVRAMNASANAFVSSYSSTGWSHKYFPTPEVTKLENDGNGINLTWGAINGAAQYRVYVKTAGGSWTRVGDSTTTFFRWTGPKQGETYYFTVRCLSADGKTFTSSYSSTGWSITYK